MTTAPAQPSLAVPGRAGKKNPRNGSKNARFHDGALYPRNPTSPRTYARLRLMKGLTLALGGGGVRGFAHLGALRVLREHHLPIKALAGSSAGAVAAAAFAFGLPLEPDPYLEHITTPRASRLFQDEGNLFRRLARLQSNLLKALRNPSLTGNERLREGLEALFGDRRLEESPIPLGIVAADLYRGEMVVLREGPVVEALLASSAVPGIFPPIPWGPYLLVDGDVVEKVPVTAARALAGGPVVAVDVSNPSPSAPPRTTFDVLLLAGQASRERLKRLAMQQADLVLPLCPETPVETFDYEKARAVYQLGIERTTLYLPALKRLLAPRFVRWLRQLWRFPEAVREHPAPEQYEAQGPEVEPEVLEQDREKQER